MKKLSAFALAFAIAGSLSVAAQAGSVTEYSNTWKPGFEAVEGGYKAYARTVHTDVETGYNAGLKQVSTVEISAAPKAGFTFEEAQGYGREVIKVNKNFAANGSASEIADTTTFVDDHSN